MGIGENSENKIDIDLLTKLVERAGKWMDDAESRSDWNDWSYYQGQRYLANELIIMLGGKAID